MLDDERTTDSTTDSSTAGEPAAAPPRRRRAASRPAGPPAAPAPSGEAAGGAEPEQPAAPVKKATRKRAAKKQTAAADASGGATADTPGGATTDAVTPAAGEAPAPRTRRTRKTTPAPEPEQPTPGVADTLEPTGSIDEGDDSTPVAPNVLFQPPAPVAAPARRRRRSAAAEGPATDPADGAAGTATEDEPGPGPAAADEDTDDGGSRRRRRGGRGRRGRGAAREDGDEERAETTAAADDADADRSDTDDAESDTDDADDGAGTGTRRRRRRRRRGGGAAETGDAGDDAVDDPPNTVVRVREPRSRSRGSSGGSGSDDDGVRSVKGSTRLEAKKQRRREGREAGRRRPPVITEAEFLARRESVERTMVVRQTGDRTQIAVLEDDVLVEHYVSNASSSGMVGNVYLGKVQNVLPSMEAAFVDIGRGRNAVLYAGEVNWDAAGLEGQPRRIELALKSGDPVLVQVTKDPIGHKGARLTSQVSLAGRYLVLVPGGSMTGISRKLPENERARLKAILKKVVPEGSGVIVRTAAEGASEEELSRDVARLTAQWEDIEAKSAKGSAAPTLLYGEPDMTIRVVRDIFNEDFAALRVAGDDAWDMLEPYVSHVAPDLRERMSRWTEETDVFAAHRIDEQLAKALDRKVWLPSGGYLIIDRTEAMVVIDVNTGKFTGQGGNLEETVTKNNLESAEEIVRQLRLRDLGGIIVIDFIDMVLESNRDLVLRRLTECLGRDRTKHQVAEVTSLGLVQMTRKRVGQGLHEAFSTPCEACNGRGYHVRGEPVDDKPASPERKGALGGGKDARRAKPAKPSKPAAAPTEPVADDEAVALPADAEPVAAPADSEPVAVEDPVEAPAPKRRRRKAVSPVTTL